MILGISVKHKNHSSTAYLCILITKERELTLFQYRDSLSDECQRKIYLVNVKKKLEEARVSCLKCFMHI